MAQADEAQRDERVVHPEQLTDELRQRREMRAHADDAWHQQAGAHEPEVQDAGDPQQQRQGDLHT
jgi:hypothetical protein